MEEVAEDINSRKMEVRVGGSNWIKLSAASRRRVSKVICAIAINFLNLAETGGVEDVEVLSGEGLEGLIMNYDAPSGVMLMVMGGL